jgi:DNA-directed RNA polymerase specialized sigma24 family protein
MPDASIRLPAWKLFDSDEWRAEEKIAHLRRQLIKFFEWNRCQSPEDLTQEALTRGIRRLTSDAELSTTDPASYFLGIARNLVYESRRDAWRHREGETAENIHGSDPYKDLDTRISLDQALARLPPEERAFLKQYHLGDRERLLSDDGASAGAIRVKAHRLLRKVTDAVVHREPEK